MGPLNSPLCGVVHRTDEYPLPSRVCRDQISLEMIVKLLQLQDLQKMIDTFFKEVKDNFPRELDFRIEQVLRQADWERTRNNGTRK